MFKQRVMKRRIVRRSGLVSRRTPSRYRIPKGTKVDYKDFNLLKKYLSDRGKILSRRITGASPKEQRLLCREIKKARYLGLISTGAR